ncbi:hypothetical protein Mal4_31750 [Maioricimonas rarisocia]|uniref:DUF423 domain-containing protein n=1 Tax=Maioricimonas rarisocia TaxID=2528026 RepID=A0A517Z8Q0_9PLAN|nr:DUF423 domain-containing protein [Maioricimonas rarisocia]QDU38845.1 hypothetical protein Mal4_31750 [Maioricimonas rarisocia]
MTSCETSGSAVRSWWVSTGAVLAGLAVVTGAFAAHGLGPYLEGLYGDQVREVAGQQIPAAQKYLADFRTAAEYQMYHALALVVCGLVAAPRCCRTLNAAGWAFVLGIACFSGSLYTLVLTGQTWLGMVTPIGGLAFILGWILLALAACPCRGTAHDGSSAVGQQVESGT